MMPEQLLELKATELAIYRVQLSIQEQRNVGLGVCTVLYSALALRLSPDIF